MRATCVDCGLDQPVELMEPRPGGAHRCLACEDDVLRVQRQRVRRRALAVAAPFLGLFALGTGLPSLVVVEMGQMSMHEASGLAVLAVPVAGLALAAAGAGLPGLFLVLQGLFAGRELPVVDRILLPLGGIGGGMLGVVGLGVAALLAFGPEPWF